MNKIKFLFGVISILLCISCSSDDEDMAITNKAVAGHWQSVSSHGYTINLITNEKEEYGEQDDNSMSFKLYDDGTCAKGSATGTYKIIGHELDMFVSYYHDFLKKEISSTYNFTIESLSSSQMVITYVWIGTNGAGNYWEHHPTYTMKKVSN